LLFAGSLALIVSGFSESLLAQGLHFRRGESNCSGDIDISDPIATLRWLFLSEPEPCCLDAADANDDGGVDISDPVYVLGFLFIGDPPPPLPHPGCGPDPTGDLLACASFPLCPQTAGDEDGDGLSSDDEIQIHKTDPSNPDTDGDGLTDGDEVLVHGTNPLAPDSDADGLPDGQEVNQFRTDPLDPDSDGGGVRDGVEIAAGTDPLDPADDLPGSGGPGFTGVVPARANVIAGTMVQFRAVFPDGGPVVWAVEGFPGVDPGAIDQNGLYSAPGVIPDPPVVIVRASSQPNPGDAATAAVTLVSAADFRLTREQAIETVREMVIDKLPFRAGAIALGAQQPLAAGDRIEPFLGPDGEPPAGQAVPGPCWFFMVDEEPFAYFAHPVRYVYVDCATGGLTESSETFFPVLNGEIFWSSPDRITSPDRVFIGSEAERALAEGGQGGGGALRGQGGGTDEVFQAAPAACDCPGGPQRYAIVVVGVESKFKETTFHPFGRTAIEVRDFLEQARFLTTLIYTTVEGARTGIGRGAILSEIERLRPIIRPCDLFLFFNHGHGYSGGLGSLNLGYDVLAIAMETLVARRKIAILDVCIAASAIRKFESPDPTLNDLDPLPSSAEILMASGSNDIGHPFAYFNILTGAHYTNAFIDCLPEASTLSEAHDCASSKVMNSLIGSKQTPMIHSTEQAAFDTDQDGISDLREARLSTDPRNPDSDGDSVCDGIEWSQLPDPKPAMLEIFNPPEGEEPIRIARGYPNRFYSYKFESCGGVAFNLSKASAANPFGRAEFTGWTAADIDLQSLGLSLDRITGVLSGTPNLEGQLRFTVQYMDGIGGTARRQVELPIFGAGIIPPGASITVTTGADSNSRDDDITLREAILLATGKLQKSALKQDPDPDDDKPEGEQRFVSGQPGIDVSDLIFPSAGLTPLTVGNSPLILDANGDKVQVVDIDAGIGPVFLISGDANEVSARSISVSSSPVFNITGNRNKVQADITAAPDEFAIRITGDDNEVSNTSIENAAGGIRLADASGNLLKKVEVVGCPGEGIVITRSNSNTVTECIIGARFSPQTQQYQILPNGGDGLLISGGSRFNKITVNTTVGNMGSGIVISGEGTRYNTLEQNAVGGYSDGRQAVLIGGNGRDGLVIRAKASRNLVTGAGGAYVGNTGNGILITDPGTNENTILGVGTRISGNTEDGIRIQGGAQANLVTGSFIISSPHKNGIVISDASSNYLISKADTIFFTGGISIAQASGAGILLQSADDNTISGVSIGACRIGISMQGASRNRVRLAGIQLNTDHGILIGSNSAENLIDGQGSNDPSAVDFHRVALSSNGMTGILIKGAGASGNRVLRCRFESARRDGNPPANQAVSIEEGAEDNTVQDCVIRKHTSAGIVVNGSRLNKILNNVIWGDSTASDIPQTGPGILIENGARENLVLGNEIDFHGQHGVHLRNRSSMKNTLLLNQIGVAGGPLPPINGQPLFFFSNHGNGVLIEDAPENAIGSPFGGGNLIVANKLDGVSIIGPNAVGNRVLGNIIGADVSGKMLMSNGMNGVRIKNGARNNIIGGFRPAPEDLPPEFLSLPPQFIFLGAGNLISANNESGIFLFGDGTVGNQVLGNLIGFSFGPDPLGNGMEGVSLSEGAQKTCIGNCFSLAERSPGFTNIITGNGSPGVKLFGPLTTWNTISRSTIAKNRTKDISVEDRANGGILPPEITGQDLAAGRVSGISPGKGIIEVFTDIPGDEGRFHLAAFVEAGPFTIDRQDPGQSQNALVFDSGSPLRQGALRMTFTDTATGNTSEFAAAP
jgi:hypothetical protein